MLCFIGDHIDIQDKDNHYPNTLFNIESKLIGVIQIEKLNYT